MASHLTLGKVGLWTSALRVTDARPSKEVEETAAELEQLGYGAIWIGGSPHPEQLAPLLDATSRITVATGILTVWDVEAAELSRWYETFEAAHPGRFLAGIGVSHSVLTDRYRRPYSAMKQYLTDLDAAPTPVPASRRVLAALGPKMLRLARERAAGAHPYLITPEYVAGAREALGADALLAPELKVVLGPDLDRARDAARDHLSRYLQLTNYTSNLLRLGFTEDDFRDGGSDRLVSALFALGDAEAVRERVDAFLAAGADHLAIQVVQEDRATELPLPEWRALAGTLPLGTE